MSQKNSFTTADPIEWNEAVNLVRHLYRDGNYTMSMFIGLGIFTGLRVSDIKRISWRMVLEGDGFEIIEQKTGKRREIRMNRGFQQHAKDCFNALQIKDMDQPCLISKKHGVYSTQRLNVLLKEIKDKYKVKCKYCSCHSLRKTYGLKIYTSSNENASVALATLSSLYNHASVNVTMKYLNITREKLLATYDLLTF